MKRWLLLIMALAMVFSLAACGGENADGNREDDNNGDFGFVPEGGEEIGENQDDVLLPAGTYLCREGTGYYGAETMKTEKLYYDENGREWIIIRYDEMGEETEAQKYYYDADGNVAKIETYWQQELCVTEVFTYDEQNRVVSKQTTEDIFVTDITYEYGEDGSKTEKTVKYEDGEVLFESTVIFDLVGNEIYNEYTADGETQVYTQEFSYEWEREGVLRVTPAPAPGSEANVWSYYYFGTTGRLYEIQKYTDGKQTERYEWRSTENGDPAHEGHLFYAYADGDMQCDIEYSLTWIYDENGRLTSYHCEYNNGETEVNWYYIYNEVEVPAN